MHEQGMTFVRHVDERYGDGRKQGEFRCACGNLVVRPYARVVSGKIKSCGCALKGNSHAAKHGGRNSGTYASWRAMLDRCNNPYSKDYPRWGGRGITVCNRWLSFPDFREDMGQRPDGTTLDRVDPDGNYEPGNCRWATPKQQARNRRDLVIVKTADGEIPLVDYAVKLGISKGAAHLRLKRGTLEGIVQ